MAAGFQARGLEFDEIDVMLGSLEAAAGGVGARTSLHSLVAATACTAMLELRLKEGLRSNFAGEAPMAISLLLRISAS